MSHWSGQRETANDDQRLRAAWGIVAQVRKQERDRLQRRKRIRDVLGVFVGSVAIWVVFVQWIL